MLAEFPAKCVTEEKFKLDQKKCKFLNYLFRSSDCLIVMGLFSSINSNDDVLVTQLAAHQSELLVYIQSLMPGDSGAHDVQQRTNLVIWKKRAQFKKGSDFRAWAFSIAYWEVKAYRKECSRKSWLVVDDTLVDKLTRTMSETVTENPMKELRTDLELCIQKLEVGDQELVTHRYYSDKPLKDYAEEVGRPVASVKMSLCRIRAALKRCIEYRRAVNPAGS